MCFLLGGRSQSRLGGRVCRRLWGGFVPPLARKRNLDELCAVWAELRGAEAEELLAGAQREVLGVRPHIFAAERVDEHLPPPAGSDIEDMLRLCQGDKRSQGLPSQIQRTSAGGTILIQVPDSAGNVI